MSQLGYEVTTAENGKEAINIFEKAWQEIDAVLLDMSMPEMDGSATFRAMRKIHPEVKVILCTGYDMTSEAQALIEEGVKATLQKPYRLDEVAEAVAKLMHGEGDFVPID